MRGNFDEGLVVGVSAIVVVQVHPYRLASGYDVINPRLAICSDVEYNYVCGLQTGTQQCSVARHGGRRTMDENRDASAVLVEQVEMTLCPCRIPNRLDAYALISQVCQNLLTVRILAHRGQ